METKHLHGAGVHADLLTCRVLGPLLGAFFRNMFQRILAAYVRNLMESGRSQRVRQSLQSQESGSTKGRRDTPYVHLGRRPCAQNSNKSFPLSIRIHILFHRNLVRVKDIHRVQDSSPDNCIDRATMSQFSTFFLYSSVVCWPMNPFGY